MRKMKKQLFLHKIQLGFQKFKKWFLQWRSETDRVYNTHKKIKDERRGSVDGFLNEVVSQKQAHGPA